MNSSLSHPARNPLPIGACIVACNEAERIGRALESLRPIVSEIVVVVDQRTQDETASIAAKYGAKVYQEPWKGFIGQKNSASEKISQPWILNLDADEALSPQLQTELQKLFLSKPHSLEKYAAFSIPRLTRFCERWIRHGDWYPDRQIRLWKRGAAHWAGEEPHAALRIQGRIGTLHAPILHFPGDQLSFQIQKALSYSQTFVEQCRRTGKKVHHYDLLIRPLWRFFRSYILRLGFLDGWQGCAVAWLGATYTFFRYALALQNQQKSPSEDPS